VYLRLFAANDEALEEDEEDDEEDLRVGDVDDWGEAGDKSGERLFSADADGDDTWLNVESFIDEGERFVWLTNERVVRRRSVLEPRDETELAGTLAFSAGRRAPEGLLAVGVRAALFFGGFGTGENLLRGRNVECGAAATFAGGRPAFRC
jgi:hypothetical protein